jgi:5-(aminomethyl)-3-furanmethanol phosphate kinase
LATPVVVKVGGGLLARGECLDVVLVEVSAASREAPVLIVPGGGPFADAVREVDRRVGLGDDAAHWMAVLAMDQYAHLIAARLPNSALVHGVLEIDSALAHGQLPILAPYRWMHDADPLSHSWDVTSDSISAWVAGQVGAARLVLVKPRGASGPALMDPFFDQVLGSHITADIVTADRIDELRALLRAMRVQ